MKTLYRSYTSQVDRSEARAIKIQSGITTASVWEQRYLCETLLSDCWQSWCGFCKEVLLLSCTGTVSRSGAPILARPKVNTWQRVGFEAKHASPSGTIHPTKQISFLRQEPTWGDQSKIIDVITTLNPSNAANLLTSFGLPLRGPRHMQLVRNACSHKNSETINEVKTIAATYGAGTGISGPADLLWCYDSAKGTNAIYSWLADFKTIAEQATLNA